MTNFTQSLAIVIGIDTYQNSTPPLRTAANDARRLADLLAEQGYTVHCMFDADAAQADLKTFFTTTLKAQVGPDDRVLVYFAGHGIALDADDGPAGYLVPQDACPEDRGTFLPMTDLHAWLTDLPYRHLLLILDCCFAGAFRWASTRNLLPVPEVIHQERYERFLRDPAWQVLTSAAYDQRALDQLAGDAPLGVAQDDGRDHSPFAQALFAALAGAGDLVPKDQGDGVITATELYLYLRDTVEVRAEEQASQRQTPGLWPLKKHDKGEYIFLVPGHELNLSPAPELTADNNPWRGLGSYDEKHGPLFFGRDDEIAELADLVIGQPFTAVLGASGTGKSSLVKAGLLPRLRRQSGETSGNWLILPPLRPTAAPLHALHGLLAEHLPGAPADLRHNAAALAERLAAWQAGQPGQKLLLVVDQLEELGTLCRDEAERRLFLALLARVVEQHPETFRLVITLRTDFEPQLALDTPLAELWARPGARYVVPPMDHDDLRQAIECPASARVLYFEPYELVNELIDEVIQTPGALPLLSFTLSEMYVKYLGRQEQARRAGETVDRALAEGGYHALGGVIGSLRSRATEEYDALPDETHRETMRRVMLRLVAVEGGDLARRRAARSELVYPDGAENEHVDEVIRRLVTARLVVEGREEGGEAYVEPAHDALVRAWDKLLAWKAEAEEYLPLQRRLAQAAAEWKGADEKEQAGLLWDDDPRLPQVENLLWPAENGRKGLRGRLKWLKHVILPNVEHPRRTAWLNQREVKFTQESVKRRARGLCRALGAGFTILLVVGILLAFGFNQQQLSAANQQAFATEQILRVTSDANANARGTAQVEEAQARATAELARATAVAAQKEVEAARIALSAKEQLTVDKERALLLAAYAAKSQESWFTDNALREVLASPGYPRLFFPIPLGTNTGATQRAWNMSDSKILLISDRSTVQMIDVRSGDQTLVISDLAKTVSRVLWNPDDAHFLIEMSTEVQVWSSQRLQPIAVTSGQLASGWNPDGSRIILRSDAGLFIWNWDTGQAISVASAPLSVAEWSADGQHFFTLGRGVLQVWAAAEATEVPLAPGIGQVGAAMSSPLGSRLLVVDSDGKLHLWTVGDSTAIELPIEAPLAEAASELVIITDTSFDPAGWEGHAVWSPDGSRILTFQDKVQIWSADDGRKLLDLTNTPASACWNPDGTEVLIDDGQQVTIVPFDGSKDHLKLSGIRTINADWIAVTQPWSPDGTRILSTGRNKVTVWDVQTGAEVALLTGEADVDITHAEWSPTGEYVVGKDDTGQVRVWSLDPALRPVRVEGFFQSWSLNGQYLVTESGSSEERVAQVWNADTGSMVAEMKAQGHSKEVSPGTYQTFQIDKWSPDGRKLIVFPSHTLLRIWDAADWQTCIDLKGHAAQITQAAWSPTGDKIATASEDSTVRVWNSDTGEAIHILEGHKGPVNDVAWSPGGTYIASAGVDGTVRIWHAETGDPVHVLDGHNDAVATVSWNPQPGSPLLLSMPDREAQDDTARIWNVETGEQVAELVGAGSNVRKAVWNATGSALAAETDEYKVYLWKQGSWNRVPDIESDAIAWSPDGAYLTGDAPDATIVVWDIAAGVALRQFTGHKGDVYQIDWSTDGRRFVSSSADGTIRLWNLNDPTASSVLQTAETGLSGAKWSPTGRFIVYATQGTEVEIYRTYLAELTAIACRRAVRNLGQAEWQEFILADSSFQAICTDKPIPGKNYQEPAVPGSRG